MLVVAALGGNALRRGEPQDVDAQRANARVAASALAEIAAHHQLVVTHGNGPQVGALALQNAADPSVPASPLDVLGAESEGMIGYLLAQELTNALPDTDVVTILTRTVVDPLDPAFATPTKPIGPVYDAGRAHELSAQFGWTVARDGDGWRRVVASPKPVGVLEDGPIRLLSTAGIVAICAGGGGIPVIASRDGLRGIEAVIDKDATSALLAETLGADALLMLTDVSGVIRAFGTPEAGLIGATTVKELRRREYAAGSMGPKVTAACDFVERTGQTAAIGALADAPAILRGDRGTQVLPVLPSRSYAAIGGGR